MISVVVPVLNEEENIRKTLEHLIKMEGRFETIVVDGGSRDKTALVANEYATVVVSKKGRAVQMNTGAGRARGSVLFFLHADCMPEKRAFLEIERIMWDPRVVGGALRYDVREGSLIYRNHVFWSNIRSRLTGIYPGDHGIFVRRQVFDRIGGFPVIPLMEDVAFCKRLKKEGRLVQADSKTTASNRRFRSEGFLKTVLQMWLNRFLFWLGVPPEKLAKYYREVR